MPVDNRRISGPENTVPSHVYVKKLEKRLLTEEKVRADGRRFNEIRQIYCKGSVVTQARGSAYVEMGKTKVICAVYGPREILKKQSFNIKGQLYCEFRFAPFSSLKHHHQPLLEEKEFSGILKEALEPVVCLHKFPKCTIDVFIMVLEDDGSALSASITCSGIALADAGIDMYDLVIGCSLQQVGEHVLVDPTMEENNINAEVNNGTVTIALMPSLKQVSAVHLDGELQSAVVHNAIKSLIDNCWNIYPVIQQCLTQSLKHYLKQNSYFISMG